MTRPRISRALAAALVALPLGVAGVAQADITPPPRAKIMLELDVGGLDSMPNLRFFVSNCRKPEDSTLEAGTPIVCTPETTAPVRVYAFREGDRIEMIDMIRRNASREESQKFLADKAKYCGELQEEDTRFLESSGVRFVSAKYRLEPFRKTGCKLSRISGTTKSEVPPAIRASAEPDTSSAPVAPSSAPPPSAPAPSAAPAAPPLRSSCGCELADERSRLPALAVATALSLAARRRRRERPG